MKVKRYVVMFCVVVLAVTTMMAPVYANSTPLRSEVHGNVTINWQAIINAPISSTRSATSSAWTVGGGGIDYVRTQLFDAQLRIVAEQHDWPGFGVTSVFITTRSHSVPIGGGNAGWRAQSFVDFLVGSRIIPRTSGLTLPRSFDPIQGITAYGETYGTAYGSGYFGGEPDLISAVGINGIEGFIRRDDRPDREQLRQARQSEILIPVYTLDGEVVDMFAITVSG